MKTGKSESYFGRIANAQGQQPVQNTNLNVLKYPVTIAGGEGGDCVAMTLALFKTRLPLHVRRHLKHDVTLT
jgi:hypothetical protein